MATSKSYHSMPIVTKFDKEKSGLLTTVTALPFDLKIRYMNVEAPLDLTVKPTIPGQITPPNSPQRSPPKKRPYHIIENIENTENIPIATKIEPKIINVEEKSPQHKKSKIDIAQKETTPNGKQIKISTLPKTHKSNTNTLAPSKEQKRVKAVRKLKFDEYTSSPVSGTIIRPLDEIDQNEPQESGDIDPQYNIVEVTDEAKAEIASIPNVIGAYLCKLCQIEFDDAFGLARHRCSCIVLLEYRCPECGKRFNCPANLASHRRWHKPKDEINNKSNTNGDSDENKVQFPCNVCGKFFKRQAYLRKHLATHNKNNDSLHGKAVKRNINDAVKTLKEGNENKIECSDESVSSSSSSHDSMASNTQNSVSNDEHSIKENFNDSDGEQHKSPTHKFRMFKCEIFTEEENIAAAALAHLRHMKDSVIRHTTLST